LDVGPGERKKAHRWSVSIAETQVPIPALRAAAHMG
jgi:hypothetical protein